MHVWTQWSQILINYRTINICMILYIVNIIVTFNRRAKNSPGEYAK